MASTYHPTSPDAFHHEPLWVMATEVVIEALLYTALSIVGVCLVALMI